MAENKGKAALTHYERLMRHGSKPIAGKIKAKRSDRVNALIKKAEYSRQEIVDIMHDISDMSEYNLRELYRNKDAPGLFRGLALQWANFLLTGDSSFIKLQLEYMIGRPGLGEITGEGEIYRIIFEQETRMAESRVELTDYEEEE